ncbi:MAG: hypothetical protein WAU36_18985 [Cyclobacteriaceae bacterium]
MNLFKDFIRLVFGIPDGEPVADAGVWLIMSVVLLAVGIMLFNMWLSNDI